MPSRTSPRQPTLASSPRSLPISKVSYQNGVPQLSRKFVARRISEGETGRLKEELKCQACGKGYKHVSSLAKHLWEHTPEWNVTSKLLISKHQQVQLLEAASILASMNEDDEEHDSDDYTPQGFLARDKTKHAETQFKKARNSFSTHSPLRIKSPNRLDLLAHSFDEVFSPSSGASVHLHSQMPNYALTPTHHTPGMTLRHGSKMNSAYRRRRASSTIHCSHRSTASSSVSTPSTILKSPQNDDTDIYNQDIHCGCSESQSVDEHVDDHLQKSNQKVRHMQNDMEAGYVFVDMD